MASPNIPPATRQEDFENPLDTISIVKEAKDVRKFLRTREAILNGEKLYNFTQSKLKERGLFGPWAFNAVQSIIDSLPGMVVGACVALIWPSPVKSALPDISDPVFDKLYSSLEPLRGPFTLLLIVYGFAFAALPPGFVTKQNWKAAQRKYLFLDGAYGVYPQFFLALAIALCGIPDGAVSRSALASGLKLLGIGMLLVSYVWVTINGWKIRTELYECDYLTNSPDMFASVIKPSDVKFFIVAGVALWVAIFLLNLALAYLALGLTSVVHHLQP